MERSEYTEYSQCSKLPQSNFNWENDENDNTAPDPLFDDQNEATMEESLISTYEELENFLSNEETLNEFETTSPQSQVKMPNYPKTVSPQNDITVQDSNSKPEIVVGSLPASVEFSLTNNCVEDINAHTRPDQIKDNQNQSTIEDSLLYINENLENFEFMEEIWNEFGATKPQNQVSTANSWDNFVTTQLQNGRCSDEVLHINFSDENANATPDQQTEYQNQVAGIGDILLDLSEELENLQPTAEDWNNPGVNNPQNQMTEASNWDKFVTTQLDSLMPTEEYFNVAGTLTSQNEATLQAGRSGPETVVASLPASEEFSPAKHFDNGSQPTATLHQKVDSTTEETSSCPQVIQSPIPSYIPTKEFYYDARTFNFQTQVNMPSHSTAWNFPETVIPQNEMAVQAGNREPGAVVSSLPAPEVFSPAKHFQIGSQPVATQHQLVKSTRDETSACFLGLQSTTPLKPTQRFYICTICNPNRQIAKKYTKTHLISAHLTEYFLSSKLDFVSQRDFQEYCDYLVKRLVLSSRKLYDRNENPLLGCQLCRFTCKREEYMQFHHCSAHEHMVRENLVRLQLDTTSITELRAKANELENSCYSDSYCFRCLNCHKKFRNNIGYQKHIKEVCEKTNGAGTSISRENVSHPIVSSHHYVTCKNCDPPKQVSKSDLLNHKIAHQLGILLFLFKPESLSEEEYKQKCEQVMYKELLSCERKSAYGKKPEFVCSFCRNILKGKQALRYHLYSKHKNVLIEKLSSPRRIKTNPG